jgi:hypothetical protein
MTLTCSTLALLLSRDSHRVTWLASRQWFDGGPCLQTQGLVRKEPPKHSTSQPSYVFSSTIKKKSIIYIFTQWRHSSTGRYCIIGTGMQLNSWSTLDFIGPIAVPFRIYLSISITISSLSDKRLACGIFSLHIAASTSSDKQKLM